MISLKDSTPFLCDFFLGTSIKETATTGTDKHSHKKTDIGTNTDSDTKTDTRQVLQKFMQQRRENRKMK